jgi:hypothetical protein
MNGIEVSEFVALSTFHFFWATEFLMTLLRTQYAAGFWAISNMLAPEVG